MAGKDCFPKKICLSKLLINMRVHISAVSDRSVGALGTSVKLGKSLGMYFFPLYSKLRIFIQSAS